MSECVAQSASRPGVRTVRVMGRNGAGPVRETEALAGDAVRAVQGCERGRVLLDAPAVAGVFAELATEDGRLTQRRNTDLSGTAFIIQLNSLN